MTIGEFFITIGFNADTVKVKDFVKSLEEMPLSAAAAIATLAGIDYKLLQIADDAFKSAVAFETFRAETGLSTQELQRWQIVAEQAHVSGSAVASSVLALQRNLAEIQLGRGNVAPFQLLGISPNQNAFAVLEQLRQRIQGLSPAMATNLISQMGLDPSFISVLRLTNTEFAKLSKTVSGLSGSQEASLERAADSMAKFGQIAKYVGFSIIARIVEDVSALVERLRELKGVLIFLGIILAQAAIYFFPFTAAILGLMLVLDDLATYFRGGDSVIGLAIDGIKKLGDELLKMTPTLNALGKLGALGSFLIAPIPTVATAVGTAVASHMTQNVNISVNSSAPAHDVAKEVKKELNKATSQAGNQNDQQGW